MALSASVQAVYRTAQYEGIQLPLLRTLPRPSHLIPSRYRYFERSYLQERRYQPFHSSRDLVPTHTAPQRSPKYDVYISRKPLLQNPTLMSFAFHRSLYTTAPRAAAPAPPTPHVTEPSPLDQDRFHVLSDVYIDELVARLEEMQEEREDVDVEYSAGVLTLMFPPHGTYVLNKQPPNKQIWVSSPISGPKRYDWVQDGGQDGNRGSWTYLRDGSTLDELLEEEMGVKMGNV